MYVTNAPPERRRLALTRASLGLGVVLVAASGLAACTGGDKLDSEKPESPDPVVSAPVEASVTKVAGELRKRARSILADEVGGVLQEYVDAAFLGDFPRADFGEAFSTFTPGAAKLADKDADLITAAAYSEAKSASAQGLEADLVVLAPRGRAAGVTANVRFVLDYDDATVTYAGRLLLTPHMGSWRIFGYDLTRDDQATGASQ